MGSPQQLFQLHSVNYVPTLQRHPVNTSAIRSRHNSIPLQQLAKSPRPCGKRQHRSSILFKIKLGKHLPAIRLRPNPKDQLVAPRPGLASSLDYIRQRQQKSSCALSIHIR